MKTIINYLTNIQLLSLLGGAAFMAGCSNHVSQLGHSERIEMGSTNSYNSYQDAESKNQAIAKTNSLVMREDILYSVDVVSNQKTKNALDKAIKEGIDKAENNLAILLGLGKKFDPISKAMEEYKKKVFEEAQERSENFFENEINEKCINKKRVKDYKEAINDLIKACEKVEIYNPYGDIFVEKFTQCRNSLKELSNSWVALREQLEEIGVYKPEAAEKLKKIASAVSKYDCTSVILSTRVADLERKLSTDKFIETGFFGYQEIYEGALKDAKNHFMNKMDEIQAPKPSRFPYFF